MYIVFIRVVVHKYDNKKINYINSQGNFCSTKQKNKNYIIKIAALGFIAWNMNLCTGAA